MFNLSLSTLSLLVLLAMPAQAQITVIPAALVLESEGCCPVPAIQIPLPAGASRPIQWKVLESKGGWFATGPDGKPHYFAPKVSAPTTFHLQVSAMDPPSETAQVRVQVNPRLPLTLKAFPQEVGSGEGTEIRLFRGDEPVLNPDVRIGVTRHSDPTQPPWVLQQPDLKADATGRILFTAPAVEAPTRFGFKYVGPHWPHPSTQTTVKVRPRLQVRLKDATRRNLVAGKECLLQVGRLDGAPSSLDWSAEPEATLQAQEGGSASFTAPQVARPTTFQIRVKDSAHPGDQAHLPIHVIPPIAGMPDLLAETLLPSVLGPDWMAPVATLTLLLGEAGPHLDPRILCPQGLQAVAYIDDPAMGKLDRQWLVGDLMGLSAVARLHPTITPLMAFGDPVTAIAVRPPKAQMDALHVVFAQLQREGSAEAYEGFSDTDEREPGSCIRGVAPDGRVWTLAGGLQHDPNEPPFQDGPLALARFGAISALAMDTWGHVYIADAGNEVIRRLAPEGLVTTLTPGGYVNLETSPERARAFRGLSAMLVDPATGHLLVADASGLHQVSPAGGLSTLIRNAAPGSVGFPSSSGHPPRARVTGLALRGEHLLMSLADADPLQVLNLRTGTRQTLVERLPHSPDRMGPLHRFAHHLPREACAAIGSPNGLAINVEDGHCLLGFTSGLAQLNLPDLSSME